MQFPHVDPIPIPAPVWLMKALSLLTLTLHFFAVQILIGSLVAVIFLSLKSKTKGYDIATSTVARRLPIVMTYVINFGVPPLLFAQVLYGRALYTSTILIAGQWIAVVFLLMACYWLLYRIADRSSKSLPSHWHAVGALILTAAVGRIYAQAMTLMLTPEAWQQMYAKTATGLQSPPHDPATEPRLFFVLVGGLLAGGLWLCLHSRLKLLSAETAEILRRWGSTLAVGGAIGELVAGYWVYSVQPSTVADGLNSPYYLGAKILWGVGFLAAWVTATILLTRKTAIAPLSIVGGLSSFLGLAGAVMVRDGIRDVTLRQKGLDVWNRQEASNWSVIALFLLLFVLGLVAIGWLLLVMKSAKPIPEQVNS